MTTRARGQMVRRLQPYGTVPLPTTLTHRGILQAGSRTQCSSTWAPMTSAAITQSNLRPFRRGMWHSWRRWPGRDDSFSIGQVLVQSELSSRTHRGVRFAHPRLRHPRSCLPHARAVGRRLLELRVLLSSFSAAARWAIAREAAITRAVATTSHVQSSSALQPLRTRQDLPTRLFSTSSGLMDADEEVGGCRHPSALAHERMARRAVGVLRAALGWQ